MVICFSFFFFFFSSRRRHTRLVSDWSSDVALPITAKGDVAEVEAMKEVFDGKPLPFSSTKSMTGHPLGAAGALETIFCIGMLEHRFIYPSINIEELDPEFAA